MGEFHSNKEHWQNCYGTVEDDFLAIDAIIGDIIFYEFAVADHISLTVREKGRFLGLCLRKNKSLMAPGSQIRLANFTNVCLGRLQCCKLGQNSDVASSAKWTNHAINKNKSSWFSGFGLSPWSHGFNPCCIHDFFFCWINNLCSSFILLLIEDILRDDEFKTYSME